MSLIRDHALVRALAFARLASGASPARMDPCPAPTSQKLSGTCQGRLRR